MKKLLLLAALAASTASAADFNNGFLVVNEGQWGVSPGSVTFVGNNGSQVVYEAYQKANPGESLGATGCFSTTYGDRTYFVSHMGWDQGELKGSQIVVAEAATLKKIAVVNDVPCGDANSICVISEEEAFVSGSQGIYKLNLADMTFGEKNYAQADANGAVSACGSMIVYHGMLFAAQQGVGVLWINHQTDGVDVFPLPDVAGFVVTGNGALYAAASNPDGEFMLITYGAVSTEMIDVEGDASIATPFSFSWHAPSIAAATKGSRVFYITDKGYAPNQIASYDFETGEFNPAFFTLTSDDNKLLYGQGLAVDPASGNLVLLANAGWSDADYLYEVDTETGELIPEKTIAFERGYRYGAMISFPDFYAPTFNMETVNLEVGESCTFNIYSEVELKYGNPHMIVLKEPTISDHEIAELEMGYPYNGDYTITVLAPGKTTLNLAASYNGRRGTAAVEINVGKAGIEDVVAPESVERQLFDLQGRPVKGTPAPGLYVVKTAAGSSLQMIK